MNVASLELCKELYELSGWEPDDCDWYKPHKPTAGVPSEVQLDIEMPDSIAPAYDLGYLLRKLPRYLEDRGLDLYGCLSDQPRWAARYQHFAQKPEMNYQVTADTPEDAVAKLAIELFKQGVLTKEQS